MANSVEIIYQVRAAFMKAKMEPPKAILLSSREEGMEFFHGISEADMASVSLNPIKPVVMIDGSEWMEIKIMDISVLWPAKKHIDYTRAWRYV